MSPLQRKRSWMNWDGLEPIAAWQPLGAPAFQDSLWDWRSAFATVGTAPVWSPAIGWTFVAASYQYLSSGYAVGDTNYTALMCFSGVTGDNRALFGWYDDPGGCGSFVEVLASSNRMDMYNGLKYHLGYFTVSPALTAGVYGFAGKKAYRNGLAESGSIPAGSLSVSHDVWIGAINMLGRFFDGSIQAFAMYDKILTPAQVWLRSQMMAHLVNADWSVWTPARRWFIPPPPPAPAAATPVLSTIYINTADIGDTSLFDDVSGGTISSTYARTGTNSFKLSGSDYLQADLTSSATKYTKIGLLVMTGGDGRLVAWQESGTEHVSLWLTDAPSLQIRRGSDILLDSPTTLETERWYCIEVKIVVHDTVGRVQVRIDGVDDMTAIGINTDADVDGEINQIRFEAGVDDVYIDDIVVREDGWCGTGGVYVVVPSAAGLLEDWSGSYANVDELPPSFDDYITATSGSEDQIIFRHSGLTSDYSQIRVVGVFAKVRLDASADVLGKALGYSNETMASGDDQDLDTIGVYARLLMTADPDGNVAWRPAAVNALQFGAEA